MNQSRFYRVYQVDSFTRRKFYGNPAGVVPQADGLSERDMLLIARELGNSETAFIFSSVKPDYDVHVRFFTPLKEVPLCGHATIAAHYIRAIENNLASVRVIQKTGAGYLPVDILKNEDEYEITMTQGELVFSDPFDGRIKEEIITALDLTHSDLNPDCPVQIVSAGHSKVMIGIRTSRTLNALKPDYEQLVQITREIGCNGYFVFTFDSGQEGILTNGRMFAPAIGIPEDPVTGNANGPLGAYLVYNKLVEFSGNRFEYTGKQGEAMDRTGYVNVSVDVDNGKPVKTRVGGHAVIVFRSEIKI